MVDPDSTSRSDIDVFLGATRDRYIVCASEIAFAVAAARASSVSPSELTETVCVFQRSCRDVAEEEREEGEEEKEEEEEEEEEEGGEGEGVSPVLNVAGHVGNGGFAAEAAVVAREDCELSAVAPVAAAGAGVKDTRRCGLWFTEKGTTSTFTTAYLSLGPSGVDGSFE